MPKLQAPLFKVNEFQAMDHRFMNDMCTVDGDVFCTVVPASSVASKLEPLT